MATNKQSARSRRSRSQTRVSVPDQPVQPAQAELRGSESVDWSSEYGYVFSDLRKLAIVSLSIFVVIVILGFFL